MPIKYMSLKEIATTLGVTYGALRQYIASHPEQPWPHVRKIEGVTRYWAKKDVDEFKAILIDCGRLTTAGRAR